MKPTINPEVDLILAGVIGNLRLIMPIMLNGTPEEWHKGYYYALYETLLGITQLGIDKYTYHSVESAESIACLAYYYQLDAHFFAGELV